MNHESYLQTSSLDLQCSEPGRTEVGTEKWHDSSGHSSNATSILGKSQELRVGGEPQLDNEHHLR